MKDQNLNPYSLISSPVGVEVHDFAQVAALRHQKQNQMRILVAPSGFKESLSAEDAADCVEDGIRTVVDSSKAIIRKVPLHDGGEGFCKAVTAAHIGDVIDRQVTGPIGLPVDSHFGLYNKKDGKTAGVLDMAAAAGLRLVPTDCRDPTVTTTYGVGELMAAALDEGCDEIIIGCGDSGTSDGGAGLLQALGVQFLDADGNEIPRASGGKALHGIRSVSFDGLHPRLKDTTQKIHIEAVCNIKNVLCGPRGVARVYGPQKGATPEQVEALSAGLDQYAAVAGSFLGRDIATAPGSGASGGLGAAILLLGGILRPRSEAINDHFEFDRLFEEHWDVVITAEGMIDSQSTQGKMTTEVARRAKDNGAQVVALAGTIGAGADSCRDSGIETFSSILQGPSTLEAAMKDTPRLLTEAAERLMRTIMVGMSLRTPSPSPSRTREPSPDSIRAKKRESVSGNQLGVDQLGGNQFGGNRFGFEDELRNQLRQIARSSPAHRAMLPQPPLLRIGTF